MDRFQKQSYERRWVRVDFTDGLENISTPLTPDTILSYVITATNETTGTDATATVVGAGDSKSGASIYFLAQDGTDGTNYKFTVRVITSTDQRCEKDILMIVRAV